MDYSYGYDYSYDAGSAVATGMGAALGILAFVYIIILAVGIFSIVCNWKVFKKAGKNGWEAIIPIYNFIVLLEITKLPIWYIIFLFIPIGNIIVSFLIYIELAKKFDQSAAFGIGLVFFNPIFMAILAFNKNYVYQAAAPVYNQQTMYNNQMNNYNGQPAQQTIYNNAPVQPQMNSQQPVQASNCSNCGAPINAGDKFCMHCGKQL